MKFQLTIPKPCNEKWSRMSPTEKGKFCASCRKEVVDFTGLTKQQLIAKVKSNKPLCGRFKKEQLNKDIKEVEKNSFSNIAATVALTTLIFGTQEVLSQKACDKIEKQSSFIRDSIKKTKEEIKLTSIEIKGKVQDESGVLPGAMILLKDTTVGVETDFEGNFSIKVPIVKDKKNILVVSFIGNETKEIEIKDYKKFISVFLEGGEHLLGEVVIIKPSLFQRFLNIFRKKENRR